MAAPVPLNLSVPSGNFTFTLKIKNQLAERAAYWKAQWIQEKASMSSLYDVRRKKHMRPDPKWGYLKRTIEENFPSLKPKTDVSNQTLFKYII